jgi:hypothetical protein
MNHDGDSVGMRALDIIAGSAPHVRYMLALLRAPEQ